MKFRLISNTNPLRLPQVEVVGIVLHWTAGHYGQTYGDYHFCVDEKGGVWQNDLDSIGTTLSHTWRRNSGRIAIAAMAMVGASPGNYGREPYTKRQFEAMCALAANLAARYGIPPEEIKTHAEWAAIDGYGPGSGDPETRWDWWTEGPVIHRKIAWYLSRQGKAGGV